MNAAVRQTLELIRSDYPSAKIIMSGREHVEIEDEQNEEIWIVDQLGNIVMHNGEWV